jgi:hypothetical protein
LEGNGISYKAITGIDAKTAYADEEGYDKTELIAFSTIIGLSLIPVLFWLVLKQ